MKPTSSLSTVVGILVFFFGCTIADVTDADLKTFFNQLRSVDDNKAGPNDIRLNYQSYTPSGSKNDLSNSKLFTSVSTTLLNRATYQRLEALYDNYNPVIGVKENITNEKATESDDFLMAVLATRVGQKMREFLLQKGFSFANSIASLKDKMKDLWFGSYSRARGQQDTSGFEHVFIGEYLADDVGGMHSWSRFYYLENAGKLDYLGYVIKRNNLYIGPIFKWDQMYKKLGGFFTGTSPEFDLAAYTVCFLVRPGENACKFDVDNIPFSVTTYPLTQNGRTYIGSAFPSAERLS